MRINKWIPIGLMILILSGSVAKAEPTCWGFLSVSYADDWPTSGVHADYLCYLWIPTHTSSFEFTILWDNYTFDIEYKIKGTPPSTITSTQFEDACEDANDSWRGLPGVTPAFDNEANDQAAVLIEFKGDSYFPQASSGTVALAPVAVDDFYSILPYCAESISYYDIAGAKTKLTQSRIALNASTFFLNTDVEIDQYGTTHKRFWKYDKPDPNNFHDDRAAYHLQTNIVHEMGHVLGLSHTYAAWGFPTSCVMNLEDQIACTYPGEYYNPTCHDLDLQALQVLINQALPEEEPDPSGLIDDLPLTVTLSNGYPNPFNMQIKINYYLPAEMPLDISVYNILGKKIRSLFSGAKKTGKYEISWDGFDDKGLPVASGVYFLALKTSEMVLNKKMLLMK
jgi:hypothetical protein